MVLVTYTILDVTECIAQCQNVLKILETCLCHLRI